MFSVISLILSLKLRRLVMILAREGRVVIMLRGGMGIVGFRVVRGFIFDWKGVSWVFILFIKLNICVLFIEAGVCFIIVIFLVFFIF